MPNTNDPKDLQSLFDFDMETCLNVQNTLFEMVEIGLDLIIPQKIEDGLVRVNFNQEIACETRKVFVVRFQTVRFKLLTFFYQMCNRRISKYSVMSVSLLYISKINTFSYCAKTMKG